MSEIAPSSSADRVDVFEPSAAALFEPARTEAVADKARGVAERLMPALFFRPGEPRAKALRNRPPLPTAG